jgi:hypothetical protein
MIKKTDPIWKKLEDEVASKGADGASFVKELQDLYEIFDPEFADWLGSLYDKEIGGFYFSVSGRDNPEFLPDIESTYQAINTLYSIGFIDSAADLPADMREKIIGFACSLQSPDDGYIYHPQWNYNDPEWRHRDSRLGRDMMWAVSMEKELGFKLPYPTANERLSSKSEDKKTPLPEHLLSKEAFLSYLNSLDWEKDAYFAGNMMAAQSAQVLAAGLADTAAEFLGKIQNKETGLWGIYSSYDAVNALLKIAAFFSAIRKPIPNAKAAAKETLKIVSSEIDRERATCCWQYNVWFSLQYLIGNLRKHGGEEGIREADEIIRELLSDSTAAIRSTKEKILMLKQKDGSFSYMTCASGGKSQGAPVGLPGIYEGTVNSTVICIHRTVEAMMAALELTMPPIYDRGDFERFLKSIK